MCYPFEGQVRRAERRESACDGSHTVTRTSRMPHSAERHEGALPAEFAGNRQATEVQLQGFTPSGR